VSDEFEIIGRIVRNAHDEVLVKSGTYWNIEVIDIRWFKDDKPTNKGIRINKEEATRLLKILGRELNENTRKENERNTGQEES
jgi:hypothetical protein